MRCWRGIGIWGGSCWENGREGWIGRDTGEFWGEGFHREDGGRRKKQGGDQMLF